MVCINIRIKCIFKHQSLKGAIDGHNTLTTLNKVKSMEHNHIINLINYPKSVFGIAVTVVVVIWKKLFYKKYF